MAGNRFGRNFSVVTFGESHGAAVGCVVDGCPAGLALDAGVIRAELARRAPGAGGVSTSRCESDEPEILSGVFEGRTLGTPIAVVIRNTGQNPEDYDKLRGVYRPGHADWAWEAKFGVRDHRGGGRASGRETAGRVAAGAVAKVMLAEAGISIQGWVCEAAGVRAACPGEEGFDLGLVNANVVAMPDSRAAALAEARIAAVRECGDSCGGVVACVVSGLPAGLGEPVFDKLDALLAQAVLSIGAVKGFEIGSGFAAAASTGSQNNDPIAPAADGPPPAADASSRPCGPPPAACGPPSAACGPPSAACGPPSAACGPPSAAFLTNNAGGVSGGISTGAPLMFRAAFKPVPSIRREQRTIDRHGNACPVTVEGRHDACICPRAVPVVEAMAALVIADLWSTYRARG